MVVDVLFGEIDFGLVKFKVVVSDDVWVVGDFDVL